MHGMLNNYKVKDFVHVSPLPDFYRGKYRMADDVPPHEREDEQLRLANLYADEFENLVNEVKSKGRSIAAFISEPFFVIPGLHIVPKVYFERIYQIMQENGVIWIADEVQSGLGRTGKYMWGFQQFGLVPDIVTVGRPLGNGHPMAAVICKKEISTKLGGYYSTFGGNPVSCAMGLAVLDVLHNEKLMSSAHNVGVFLRGTLNTLKHDYPDVIGEVRGQGLLWAIEIIENRAERMPSSKLATDIMMALKDEKILVGTTGECRNVILFSPPLCFTIENCKTFIQSLASVIIRLKKPGDSGTQQNAHQEAVIGHIQDNYHSTVCISTAGGLILSKKRRLSEDDSSAAREIIPGRNKYEDLD